MIFKKTVRVVKQIHFILTRNLHRFKGINPNIIQIVLEMSSVSVLLCVCECIYVCVKNLNAKFGMQHLFLGGGNTSIRGKILDWQTG